MTKQQKLEIINHLKILLQVYDDNIMPSIIDESDPAEKAADIAQLIRTLKK